MSTFKCKMCGGTLEIEPNETIATCEYCGTQQTYINFNSVYTLYRPNNIVLITVVICE